MRLNEKTIDRTVIYNGSIIDLEVHDVELPDGSTSKRELVFHHGAVAVCAITPEGESLEIGFLGHNSVSCCRLTAF